MNRLWHTSCRLVRCSFGAPDRGCRLAEIALESGDPILLRLGWLAGGGGLGLLALDRTSRGTVLESGGCWLNLGNRGWGSGSQKVHSIAHYY